METIYFILYAIGIAVSFSLAGCSGGMGFNYSPSATEVETDDYLGNQVSIYFQLQPRDVVYVDNTGLAEWNRFITLILPTTSLINSSTRAIE